MATRKGRTGRKTKRIRRMQTRTKSRRYKMRGGDRITDINADIQTLATEVVEFYFKLSKGEVLSEKDKQSISGKQAEITKLYVELDTLTLNNNPFLVYS